jgi:hypothetical protein
MPRQSNLRDFLRKEVLRNRIKPPSPPSHRPPSPEATSEQTPLDVEAELRMNETINNDEVELDSLFGLPINELEAITKGQALQAQLEQLLAQGPACSTSPVRRTVVRDPDLMSLKEELKMLVTADLEASPRERELVNRQRAALVMEITGLEAEERKEEVRGLKGVFTFLVAHNLSRTDT